MDAVGDSNNIPYSLTGRVTSPSGMSRRILPTRKCPLSWTGPSLAGNLDLVAR